MAEKTTIKVEQESSEKLKKHSDLFSKPNNIRVYSRMKEMAAGNSKEKYIESKEFRVSKNDKNPVVKNSLIGVRKDGKMIWGRDR